MVTDKDYNKISEDVYDVDSKKESKPLRKGISVADGKYKFLKTEDNTSNGMQAMAVTPVKESLLSAL
ncbi:hypothetical protein [Streptococcus macacae]|uniref:Uncharacterized protein n=1 Tax=Streptococcus macacae NCTC 11558 TaxID=764298 RepID=G5JVR1_9STRE|nr:hypothetical protein [Streptococcus macacae]EHJ52469.1 hypothetical protein STRMA_0917 [Streptococcus macacae NCTC 11558]SUN78727.1 Uncharacterised protein [Streptococcus macacae NCTC 11558]